MKHCYFSRSGNTEQWAIVSPVPVLCGEPMFVDKSSGDQVYKIAGCDSVRSGKKHRIHDFIDCGPDPITTRNCARCGDGFVAGHTCADGLPCEGA